MVKEFIMGKYLITKAKTGFNFNLLSGNTKSIGNSQVYKTCEAAKAGCKSVKNAAAKAGIEDQTAKNVVVSKKPKFEIYADKKGAFRFRLVATNGENVLASQGYSRKDNCKRGIAAVVENCDSPIEVEASANKK